MIKVLLADDQALVRAGFRALLDAQDDIEVVGEASDGDEAVAMARRYGPDVVLMDIRMPGTDGLAATRAIVGDERLAGIRIVILTTFELDEYVFEAIRSGASGFLVKDTEPVELLRAVRSVAAGDALLSPGVTRRLIGAFATQTARAPSDPRAGRADRARARGHEPRGRGPVERRDRRAPLRQPHDGQDAREPGDDQARGPRPCADGGVRLRVGPRPPRLVGLEAEQAGVFVAAYAWGFGG